MWANADDVINSWALELLLVVAVIAAWELLKRIGAVCLPRIRPVCYVVWAGTSVKRQTFGLPESPGQLSHVPAMCAAYQAVPAAAAPEELESQAGLWDCVAFSVMFLNICVRLSGFPAKHGRVWGWGFPLQNDCRTWAGLCSSACCASLRSKPVGDVGLASASVALVPMLVDEDFQVGLSCVLCSVQLDLAARLCGSQMSPRN